MGKIRAGMVVTRSDRMRRPKAIKPGNREWATAICCVAGDGYAMPPLLVLKGRYHLASWYGESQVPDEWAIAATKNGWTDNETGFQWLKHFDLHSKRRQKGAYRMLVLDGHISHVNPKFQSYCKERNIIPLCLPAHSSHLTQPLDVGCFKVLKDKYGDQITRMAKARLTLISKADFLVAFKAAFLETMAEETVKGGFEGSGLIPFNPETVYAKCDVNVRASTPCGARPGTASGSPEPWVPKTPQTAAEGIAQTAYLQKLIVEGGSPTAKLATLDQLSRGFQAKAHGEAFQEQRAKESEAVCEGVSKRRAAKRTRLQDGEVLTGSQSRAMMAGKEAVEEGVVEEGVVEGERPSKRRWTGERRRRICRKTSHDARKCPDAG